MFTGCIGLIIVLVLPDLKVQQERERKLVSENRRLRERVRKDRMVADQRHSEVANRLRTHDVALGIDTGRMGALPGSADIADAPIPMPVSADEATWLMASWYWAQGLNRQGPVPFSQLRALWLKGQVTGETLVWCSGMAKWTAVGEIPLLEDVLDA